jgi:hypothetical protein
VPLSQLSTAPTGAAPRVPHTPRALRGVIAAAAALAVLVGMALFLGSEEIAPELRKAVSNVAFVVGALVAALNCGWAARWSTGRERTVWGLLSATVGDRRPQGADGDPGHPRRLPVRAVAPRRGTPFRRSARVLADPNRLSAHLLAFVPVARMCDPTEGEGGP